ncbi:hypothetical protein F2Q69_00049810 [Brassica cretica]|uniref:Uncharacterized protein n=1 Tax=Brassica cretica TaxID=69181 RepID=A0A8S9PUN6_BRACR|nr:hypothetical protein F2Q69_00049810 [Brassica cretica]
MAATKMFFITWFSSSTHLKVFSDLEDSGLEDFQTSRRLPDDFQEVFNQMVLIFYLDMYFVFQIWGLIYMFSRSRSNFGRLMGSLLGSLLKYNALEDFKEVFQDDLQEVFQTTSRKSSRRLSGSLPDDFKEVF